MKKLFFNFNQNFVNLAYSDNFYNIYDYIKNINNESLNQFYNSGNFEKKTKNLFDFFFQNKNKINYKKADLTYYEDIGKYGIVSKITDNLFFVYANSKDKVRIYEYNSFKDKILYIANLEFFQVINTVSASINNDLVYIYACLAKKKKVKIFIYNLKKELLYLSDLVIKDENENEDSSFSNNDDNYSINSMNNRHFDKCIQLTNHLIAISDYQELSIWKIKDDIKVYSKIKHFTSNDSFIKDMVLVENEIFVCLFNKLHRNIGEIIYFNYNNLAQEKKITNIDCFRDNVSCLYLFKQYLLIKGNKGISILSNITREIVQYLDLFAHEGTFYVIISNNNDFFYNIFINGNSLIMEKFKYIEGLFIKTEEYNNIGIEEEDKDELLNSPNRDDSPSYSFQQPEKLFSGFCLNEEQIFIWKFNIFKFNEYYENPND